MSDPDNYLYDSYREVCMSPMSLPSAYTPTYADFFTQIIESYLYINNVVPATIDGPDALAQATGTSTTAGTRRGASGIMCLLFALTSPAGPISPLSPP